jgi:hypothetical protein
MSRFRHSASASRRMPFAAALLLGAACCAGASGAAAQDLLIRNATVHTGTAQGRLDGTDVLVRNGRIAAIGEGLSAADGTASIDAAGRPLTAGLFAGITALGLEEVQLEADTVDHQLAIGGALPPQDVQWRPEFDVSFAFNPESAVIGVNRVEGLTFTVIAPSALAGSAFVTGQGMVVTLDGRFDAELPGTRALFINMGANASSLVGGSRAAQMMFLEQAIAEARRAAPGDDPGLLTAQGRATLARYLDGGRIVFKVDRAADIHQVLKLAQRHTFRPIIAGGAEAWKLADVLAQRRVPVLLDPLVNLPGGFDQIGARLDNAARLHAAGVTIGFSQSGDTTNNARKIRQLAGNAVTNGLPWDASLAALTLNPARMFGLEDRGAIATGQAADLVLWSGDPLEVTTWAEQVWIGGRAQPTRSRQTELLDRYLPRAAGAR